MAHGGRQVEGCEVGGWLHDMHETRLALHHPLDLIKVTHLSGKEKRVWMRSTSNSEKVGG